MIGLVTWIRHGALKTVRFWAIVLIGIKGASS